MDTVSDPTNPAARLMSERARSSQIRAVKSSSRLGGELLDGEGLGYEIHILIEYAVVNDRVAAVSGREQHFQLRQS